MTGRNQYQCSIIAQRSILSIDMGHMGHFIHTSINPFISLSSRVIRMTHIAHRERSTPQLSIVSFADWICSCFTYKCIGLSRSDDCWISSMSSRGSVVNCCFPDADVLLSSMYSPSMSYESTMYSIPHRNLTTITINIISLMKILKSDGFNHNYNIYFFCQHNPTIPLSLSVAVPEINPIKCHSWSRKE